MAETTIGNSRFAGKAARNCATGCTRLAARGRVPTQTPIGTQMQLAMAISTTTRLRVARPSRKVVPHVGEAHARGGKAHDLPERDRAERDNRRRSR